MLSSLPPKRTKEIEKAILIIAEECNTYSVTRDALAIVADYIDDCESYIQNYIDKHEDDLK